MKIKKTIEKIKKNKKVLLSLSSVTNLVMGYSMIPPTNKIFTGNLRKLSPNKITKIKNIAKGIRTFNFFI